MVKLVGLAIVLGPLIVANTLLIFLAEATLPPPVKNGKTKLPLMYMFLL